MRAWLDRLGAAVTPGVLALLAALLLALGVLPQIGRDDGQTALERRAAKTLSLIQGAGDVRVVIRTKTGTSAVLSGGKQEETPCGAVAVAQGADDPFIRMELERALCALLGLPASAVEIATGGEGA